MTISLVIMFGCLGATILCVVMAERGSSPTRNADAWWAKATLVCGYGVCVGIVALVIGYFFGLSEWWAIAAALPLGFPVLLLAGKMGEV